MFILVTDEFYNHFIWSLIFFWWLTVKTAEYIIKPYVNINVNVFYSTFTNVCFLFFNSRHVFYFKFNVFTSTARSTVFLRLMSIVHSISLLSWNADDRKDVGRGLPDGVYALLLCLVVLYMYSHCSFNENMTDASLCTQCMIVVKL